MRTKGFVLILVILIIFVLGLFLGFTLGQNELIKRKPPKVVCSLAPNLTPATSTPAVTSTGTQAFYISEEIKNYYRPFGKSDFDKILNLFIAENPPTFLPKELRLKEQTYVNLYFFP